MLRFLQSFLYLGVIIPPLPNNILDGQLIDAVPVMQNFNAIVTAVNANVPALVGNNTFVPSGSVGGSGNAITLAPSPIISAYAQGQTFTFQAINFNTGSTTIQTSGLATRPVRTAEGNALSGQEIVAGGIYTVTDTGSVYQLTNGAQGAEIVFTPTLTFGGASTGVTYSRQEGRGWKVNNIFYFTAAIVLTNKGSSTGFVRIAGLPYTVNVNFIDLTCAAFVENVTYASYVMAYIEPNNTVIDFVDIASGSTPVVLDDTSCTNTSTFTVQGWYPV